jgi:hypothetical protein
MSEVFVFIPTSVVETKEERREITNPMKSSGIVQSEEVRLHTFGGGGFKTSRSLRFTHERGR